MISKGKPKRLGEVPEPAYSAAQFTFSHLGMKPTPCRLRTAKPNRSLQYTITHFLHSWLILVRGYVCFLCRQPPVLYKPDPDTSVVLKAHESTDKHVIGGVH
jgi:hypothetical protein